MTDEERRFLAGCLSGYCGPDVAESLAEGIAELNCFLLLANRHAEFLRLMNELLKEKRNSMMQKLEEYVGLGAESEEEAGAILVTILRGVSAEAGQS